MATVARNLCLKRRMLFAAGQCYDPAQPPPGAVGWIDATGAPGRPVAIVRDFFGATGPIARFHVDQKTDLALVGRIAEGVLVAFRGTLPPLELRNGRLVPGDHGLAAILLDWLNNVDTRPYGGGHYPGRVHDGFARSLDRLWGQGAADGLEGQIGALLAAAAPGQRRLYITGHSKGGALASLAAWRARRQWDVPVHALTIAAARAGDDAFAAGYAQAQIPSLRYEVDTDIVPYLPFGAAVPAWVRSVLHAVGLPYDAAHFGYAAVGAPVIDARGVPGWLADFGRRLGGSLFASTAARSFLPTIVDAHRIDAGSRYDGLVCERSCGHRWP